MKNNFIRYIEPLWINWKFFLPGLLYPFNIGLFSVISVYVIKQITTFIEQGEQERILIRVKWYIGYLIVYYIVDFIAAKLSAFASWNHLRIYFQSIYIPKYITLDNNFTERIGTGRFVAIIEKGIHVRVESLSHLFYAGLAAFITIVGSLLIIAQTNILWAFISIGLIIIVMTIIAYLDQFALIYRNIRRDREHTNTSHVVKLIMSKFEVMQSGKIVAEVKKLKYYFSQAEIYNQKTANYINVELRLPNLLVDMGKIVLILVVGMGVIEGKYTYADFVALSGLVFVIDSALIRMSRIFKDTTKNLTYIYKIFEIFDEAVPISGYSEGEIFNYIDGNISLKNIGYGYHEEKVFDGFTLEIEGGKKTALVGISGSGKSTLVKLISGYLQTNEGVVHIDGQALPGGHDEDAISLESYYQHIGYLTQEPMVFDGTIEENLIYAIDATLVDEKELQDRIDRAIKASKCDFIYDFPKGLETEIGEKGIRLSGGQRQRLAIAKIFLKDPQIVILDEPTSSLDSFSEEVITEAMHTLFEGRTVIIIAHRLQTVKAADDIILLEDSEIVERGTHDELVELGGQYARMLELQSGF